MALQNDDAPAGGAARGGGESQQPGAIEPHYTPENPPTITELAALGDLAYDQIRQQAAEALGVRVSTLDGEVKKARASTRAALGLTTDESEGPALFENLEPWPEPVDGDELLDEVAAIFRRHVALVDHAAEAMALWVLFTYVHDHVRISPMLAFVSATMRCGKTTALSLLSGLCFRVIPASNISPGVVYRAIERWRPTLLLDEADAWIGDNEALRGILNSGQTRHTAFVLRCDGENDEPKAFSTWTPKAIAAIRGIPGTLTDRSITIPMRRRLPNERVEKVPVDVRKAFRNTRRRCARWAADNGVLIEGDTPMIPDGLHDRAADNWEPILSIGEAARGPERVAARTDWASKARAAAVALSGASQEEETVAVRLLADIREIFTERAVDRISSADLVSVLGGMEDRPWAEWGKANRPITVRQVARLLAPFNVTPKNIKVASGAVFKGYTAEQFADAWGRYLPATPFRSATPLPTNNDAGLIGSASATNVESVADGNGRKPAPLKAGSGVADEIPPDGEVF